MYTAQSCMKHYGSSSLGAHNPPASKSCSSLCLCCHTQAQMKDYWPLANNAGGVAIFNLTTDQRAFEVSRILVYQTSCSSGRPNLQLDQHM
jgi:hypothetical protein